MVYLYLEPHLEVSNFHGDVSFTRAEFEGTFGFLDSDSDEIPMVYLHLEHHLEVPNYHGAELYMRTVFGGTFAFSIRTGTAKSLFLNCTWSLTSKFPNFTAVFL